MKSILVVDDSFTIRDMVTSCLQGDGIFIQQAEDGVEALEFAKKTNFDIVITDNNMPNMKGNELTAELRKLEQYKRIPILILSTESDPNLKQQGKDAGVTGWILKPINPKNFKQIIDKMLNKLEA